MIIVKTKVEDNLYRLVEISGHAEYDESGKDIVCAAVSAASILTVNGIEIFDKSQYVKVTDDDGYLNIEVKKNSCKTVQLFLENLMNALTELEQDYPNYIKIEK